MVAVRKPCNGIRLCIDPTPLNRVIKRNHYPLPTIDDFMPMLSKQGLHHRGGGRGDASPQSWERGDNPPQYFSTKFCQKLLLYPSYEQNLTQIGPKRDQTGFLYLHTTFLEYGSVTWHLALRGHQNLTNAALLRHSWRKQPGDIQSWSAPLGLHCTTHWVYRALEAWTVDSLCIVGSKLA